MGTVQTIIGEQVKRPVSRAKPVAGSREGRMEGVPQYTCGTLPGISRDLWIESNIFFNVLKSFLDVVFFHIPSRCSYTSGPCRTMSESQINRIT